MAPTTPLALTTADARRLAVRCQGLDGACKPFRGKAGAATMVGRLGYVQIDTIAVVERAHHHTLWARVGGYRPEMLGELLVRDRQVFEYWDHAACYVPMRAFRFSLAHMMARAASEPTRQWRERLGVVAPEVLRRIRDEGPLTSADFEAPAGTMRSGWWDWKPAKEALELLFATGELMVSERRGFQRVYDLPERVLPAWVDATVSTAMEQARHEVMREARAQGLVRCRTVHNGGDEATVAGALADLASEGALTPVAVDGEAEPLYALAEALDDGRSAPRKRLHILSPFDNLTRDRRRLERWWGFDYGLECYLPQAKRRYGYFVLPVLWGDALVARMDAKADRRARSLIVRRVMLEPGFRATGAFVSALGRRLNEFAAFNGCDAVAVEASDPPGLAARLRSACGGGGAE